MPSDLLSFNHASRFCCAPLSAIPAGMVSHYQPADVLSLTGHAFWYGASLSAMPAGVVPH